MSVDKLFAKLANKASHWMGKPTAFLLALFMVIIWALSGPVFGFSDTWELIINTATTIITFLMVFLIQNTQNRDAQAIHLKLDELILAIGAADNSLMDAEQLSEKELLNLAEHYHGLGKRAEDLHLEKKKKN